MPAAGEVDGGDVDTGGAIVATVAEAPQSASEEPFGQQPLSTQ